MEAIARSGIFIAPAPIGGVYASDVRVRLTAWGPIIQEAIANLQNARITFPKGIRYDKPRERRHPHRIAVVRDQRRKAG